MLLFINHSHEYLHGSALRVEQVFILDARTLLLDCCFVSWFSDPYAISGLGRITVPDDIKSGFPCSAKEPGDVTWKCIKALNIRKYEKRACLTDKLPSPSPFCGLLQGVTPSRSFGPPPGKPPLCSLFRDIGEPSRKHLPADKQCLSQITVGL